MVPSLLKRSLFLAAFGMLAASAHAQVSLFSQNFDGYTVGSNVPAGTGQSFSNVTGAFPVANTAGLFPAASSGSATAGGDAARFNELNVVTNLNIATVPEPSTYACMCVALGGLGVYARNRRARREA